MKNFIYYISLFLIFISCSLTGCALEEYTSMKEKPNELYYTAKLSKAIKKGNISIRILETNFYKEVVLKKENLNLITDFINEVNNNDLIEESITDDNYLPEKSLYKIYVDIDDNEKYIIEVYGDDLISIFPWDGYYKKDILKLNNLPASLKPEALCKYILSL